MAKPKFRAKPAVSTAANVGYEAERWQMADLLRGSMDVAESERVVLGPIVQKYISDAVEEEHAEHALARQRLSNRAGVCALPSDGASSGEVSS